MPKELTPKVERRLYRRIALFGPTRTSRIGRLAALMLSVLLIFMFARQVTEGQRTRHLVDSGIRQRNAAFCTSSRQDVAVDKADEVLYAFLTSLAPMPGASAAQKHTNAEFRQLLQTNLDNVRKAEAATLDLRTQLGCTPINEVPRSTQLPPITTT